MSNRSAYSNVIDTTMTFDEYVEFSGIEPGSSEYLELQSAYKSAQASGISVEVDYATLKSYLENAKNAQAADAAISGLNTQYASPNLEVSVANWVSDPNTIVLRDINGNIISIYYMDYGVIPAGTPYPLPGLTNGYQLALSASQNESIINFERSMTTPSGESVTGFVGSATSAILGVACAAAFAKNVRAEIYEKSKTFWGKDLYQFDPDWWDAQFAGDNLTGFRAFVAENIFSVDPDTDKVTMYVDADFAAGIAAYLNSKGWFDITKEDYRLPEGSTVDLTQINYPVRAYTTIQTITQYEYFDNLMTRRYVQARTYKVKENGVKMIILRTKLADENRGYDGYSYSIVPVSKTDFSDTAIELETVIYKDALLTEPETITTYPWKQTQSSLQHKAVNGQIIYARPSIGASAYMVFKDKVYKDSINYWPEMYCRENAKLLSEDMPTWVAAYVALYGNIDGSVTVEGVNDMPNSDPLTVNSTKVTPQEFRYILPANFPELWAKSFTRGVPQADGSIKTKTYIPVPIPNGAAITSPLPITGTTIQADVSTKIDTLPKTSQSTIVNNVSTTTDTSTIPSKGDSGNIPLPILPTGTASSMWAVYNPSQAEVDSFGSWMWSSDLFEQIKKIFNDPMQAIIGIHKVFASPSIGGRRSIKVGYIDSGVSANYVSNQYTTVNCGSVNLYEYFGNVFDYSPFTSVKLYLPFVGVVPLDVADVMRSTISVVYGVDVYTGDCLAKVIVDRDNSSGVLYSYPGNCAVKYPYSSGSYLGIIGFGASIAATVATGVPMITSPKGALQTPHGGSFSGNCGATGPKTPYLIVTRPQSAVARNFNSLEGYPVNFTTQIGACRGFIRVKECHLSGINATDEELDMIDQILKDGIIVQS